MERLPPTSMERQDWQEQVERLPRNLRKQVLGWYCFGPLYRRTSLLDPTRAIHTFLDRVSRRLRRRAAWTGAFYLLAMLTGLALVGPLLAYWAKLDSSTSWIWVVLAALALILCWVAGISLPRRRWRERRASAHYVGEQVQPIASDLLSSVEFIAADNESDTATGSKDLRAALYAHTAQRLVPLRLRSLVPYAGVRRAFRVAMGIGVLYLGAALVAPSALAQGWSRLFTPAAVVPFDGATLSEEPLVGDVDILVEFPAYTGKPSLRLPASSGDFEAMPGSTVSISTRPTGAVVSARILLSQDEELSHDEEIELTEQDGLLGASMEVITETYYRFEVNDGVTRRIEARAHHIGIRTDKTPTVQLYAPADELDVAKVKRVELAYVAADDFGIRKVELVYQALGGKEYRQALDLPNMAPDAPSAGSGAPKNAQSKHLWDLAELPLRPGVQIQYHLEVTDNDEVLGPNVGHSKSYKLRLYSPRERHEDLIARQRELAEHMLELLAERLVGTEAGLAEHRRVHRMAGDIIVEMGSLVAALKSDELATKKLTNTIVGLRKNMNKRAAAENGMLSELEARARRVDQVRLKKDRARQGLDGAPSKRLRDSDSKIIAELEDDVLTIIDWLQRQELENLLGISDEIKASQERLDKLFEEYNRTGSKELLEEIERELKALERRLQEMASKSASMPEDVLDRFVNSDALQQEQEADCLAKVREFLDVGDVEAAHAQMAKCSEEMDQGAKALEEALQSLRGDRFSKEEKLFEEMMDAMADLSQDQQDIADRADEIYERYAEAASQLQDHDSEAKKSAKETLGKLRKKLKQIPESVMTPFAKEELDILNKRLDDAEKMMKRGDLAEALNMARHANESLQTVQDDLEFNLDDSWSRNAVVADKAARQALPLARKLVDELKEATPSPSEIMSKEDRRNLDKLRRQQKAAHSRGQKLRKKAAGKADQLPGKAGKAMQEGLKGALKHMKRAGQQMRDRDPSSARQEAQQAAQRLKQTQESARSAARQKQKRGRPGWRDEPVRIPGAEDYKAPEKFRKEIMDAMKDDSAPAGFTEQVKRYYKDIIQ